jgi:hypothetical protein
MRSITGFLSFRRSVVLAGIVLCATMTGSASAQLRVTEAMSSSAAVSGGTGDWFELTNYGGSAVSIAGWKVDDSSFSAAAALPLNVVTSIGAGESAIFIEVPSATVSGSEAQLVADWRSFWGNTVAATQVGWYKGSGIGLSSSGDGLVVFDAANAEQTSRVSFPAATAGSSFYWAYTPSGGFGVGSSTAGVVSQIGTLAGENGGISQTTLLSADPPTAPFTVTNIGSPGTAALVPEPSTVALAAAGIGLAGLAARRRGQRA